MLLDLDCWKPAGRSMGALPATPKSRTASSCRPNMSFTRAAHLSSEHLSLSLSRKDLT